MTDKKFFLKKGLWLGIVLVIIQKVFCILITPDFLYDSLCSYFIGSIFGFVVMCFLMTDKASNLFITGFTGLAVLIGAEILLSSLGLRAFRFGPLTTEWLYIYFAGFVGSMVGAIIAIVLTLIKFKAKFDFERRGYDLENAMKIKLLLYGLISALSFTFLVLPENAGVSVLIFALLQLGCLFYLLPKKKAIWAFIPVLIFSLNALISGNTMWRVTNVIVSVVLYNVMVLLSIGQFPVKKPTFEFLFRLLENIVMPLAHFNLPSRWLGDINQEKTKTIKRILIGVLISLPCLIILTVLLSSADAVFSKSTQEFFKSIWQLIHFNVLFKSGCGILVGLYMFGLLYIAISKEDSKIGYFEKSHHGDLLILNILLVSVLFVYTLFAVIQFRYLFAGGQLPYGLTSTEYARRGFFELLLLTGLNILLILITVGLTKEKRGGWSKVTKSLCCYLCAITLLLLVSSFYRMWLYSWADGFTRLRLLVFGFLIFEGVGLLLTFFYIIKPRFNIVSIYLVIGLLYYMTINVVPIDGIIAKNQVERYIRGDAQGIDYILTLSTDAAPQIARLIADETVDAQTITKAKKYFENMEAYYGDFVPRWQRTNLSVNRARETWEKLSQK